MTTGYQPYEPYAQGLQWFFSTDDNYLVSERQPGAMSFTATVTEDISSVWLNFNRSTESTGWTVEIYDLTAGVGTTGVSVAKFQPSVDAQNVDAFKAVNGSIAGQTNLYQALQTDTDGTPADTDDFIGGIFGGGYEYGARFGSLSGTYTGKRIVSVRLDARVTPEIDYYLVQPMTITPYLYIDGKRWFGSKKVFADPKLPDGYEFQELWSANPSTGCAWSVADVEDFDTSGSSYAGWVVQPTGTSNTVAEIRSAELQVRDLGTDDRVGIGCVPASGQQWVEVPVIDPAGGVWSKTSGNEYLLVLRRTTNASASRLEWRRLGLNDGAVPGVQDWTILPVTVLSSTGRPQLPLPAEREGAFAVTFERDADGNTSQDGVPYSGFGDDVGNMTDPENYWTRVHSENTITGEGDSVVEQEFTPGANGDFSFVRVLCRLVPGAYGELSEASVAPLQIGIYTRAGDALQGSIVEIQPSDLVPDRRVFQTVKAYIATPASLTSGTQYYIRISSAALPSDVGSWAVGVASNMPDGIYGTPPADSGNASYGGQTNAYTLASPSAATTDEQQGLDAMVTVHIPPAAPTGWSVVTTPTPTGASFPCSPQDLADVVNHPEISWTPTALGAEGGGFAQYEIERDDGEGYQQIAVITSEACSMIEDHEAIVNDAAYPVYRMRVVRVDGAASLYTTPTAAPLTMLDHGGFAYTTNFFPDRGVWYGHLDPTEYEWPTSPVDREMYMRDGSIRYQELEDRLTTVVVDVMARTLGAAGANIGLAQGEAVFDPLLYLAQVKQVPSEGYRKLTHPYVCVRSAAGERWFSYLSISEGSREEPQGVYMLGGVTIRQATRTPAPMDQTCVGSGS